MKRIDTKDIDRLPGRRIGSEETFSFRCHPDIACFNRCCRNLNLFLYPYDVVRLKRALGIRSGEFIDRYVDVVMREGNSFPDVLLKMASNAEKTCPYLTDAGCSVYADRPDACRTFPLEMGVLFGDDGRPSDTVFFFRPPAFCRGPEEAQVWTPRTWMKDQEAETYHRMTTEWSRLKRRFTVDSWGPAGMNSPPAKMAFMATYNMDAFREFVFGSSFLKRYKVGAGLLKKIKRSDTALLRLGFSWVKLILFGRPSAEVTLKRK